MQKNITHKLMIFMKKIFILSTIFVILSISFACNQNKPSNELQVTDPQGQTKSIANTEQRESSYDLLAKVKDPQSKTSVNKPYKNLPKIIDLGADKCIPCKMMKPILEELKTKYDGKLIVEIIDVWENPKEGDKYNISLIPTQIFFDPDGKEFYRHEGFMSKEDILNAFKQKGINLD